MLFCTHICMDSTCYRHGDLILFIDLGEKKCLKIQSNVLLQALVSVFNKIKII